MKIAQKYQTTSQIRTTSENSSLLLSADLNRELKVSLKAKILKPIIYREAMLCLREIVISDARMQKKDRTAYFEWFEKYLNERIGDKLLQYTTKRDENIAKLQELQKERFNLLNEIEQLFPDYNQAERAFWAYIQSLEISRWRSYDPVITVHPDTVLFEAFSVDESIYGCISLNNEALEVEGEVSYGTTNVDFSKKLADEFRKVRSYKPLSLEINTEGFTVDSNTEGSETPHIEKKIDLPESWVKGFLQVSTCRNLSGMNVKLTPSELYDILSFLRRKKANYSPRALRFELTPNEYIRVNFEPWEESITLSSTYQGSEKHSIRVWGRRRLFLLERLIPIANSFTFTLLGTGLPVFVSAFINEINFTIGFSGWSRNDWSTGALLSTLSSKSVGEMENPEITEYIKNSLFVTKEELFQNFDEDQINMTIQYLFRTGRAVYDSVDKVIRYRELSATPFPQHITQLSKTELEANNLFYRTQIKKVKKKSNMEIQVEALQAENSLNILLNSDGQVIDGKCNCSKFFKSGLKQGLCAHLLAVLIKYLNQEDPLNE